MMFGQGMISSTQKMTIRGYCDRAIAAIEQGDMLGAFDVSLSLSLCLSVSPRAVNGTVRSTPARRRKRVDCCMAMGAQAQSG